MSLLAVLTLKVSAILLLALIGALVLRRGSAAARHWVLAVGVVSAATVPALHVLPTPPVARMDPVGPFLFDALQPSGLPPAASSTPPAPARPPGPYVPSTEPVDAGVVGSVVGLQPAGPRPGRSRPGAAAVASAEVVGRLAVTIWLVGAFAGLGVLLVGLARLRWFRASSSRVTDGRWHRLCADLSRSCGLNRGVDLLLGPRPGLVATWGWRRPVVMLPASASEWSAERMRVVLLHELAHARRGDWLLQMAAEALRCVWWFNPLAWMVSARLRRESEHAADDLVLARGVPAATCATHLVELARDVRRHRRTWLPAPAMARSSNLERRLSAMLNPRTNRRPMTRFARFGSLGALVTVSMVVAGLQQGTVSASRSAESTGGAVEREQPAASPGGRLTELDPVAAAPAVPAALGERVQVASVSPSRSAESTGSAVERGQPAESSSGRLTEFVLVAAAPAALQERAQAGPVSASRSAESTGSAVEQERPAEPSSGRLTELVPVSAAPAALQERVQNGPVSASPSAESIGNTVEPEQPAAPSSERIPELVAKATGLHEQQQTVLDEQQAPLGDADRPTGRPEARTGIQGAAIEEATTDPTGEVEDIEVVRSIPRLDEADEGRGAPGVHTPEADADDGSYRVPLAPMAEAQVATPDYLFLDTVKTSTLQRELQEAADTGYRLVSGYGSWGRPTVILERVLEPEPIEYLLLATAKTGTLQDEIAEAATHGYRFTSVFEIGGEAVAVMQRTPGQADPTHEYVVLGTKRLGTMEEEFLEAAANGFKLVGQTHYSSPSSITLGAIASAVTLGAAPGAHLIREMLAVLERSVQDPPSQHVTASTARR